MANAPTRPPNRSVEGRPPRGRHRVTRPIRPEELTLAAQQLDEAGHAASASLVREVAAPDGWKRLRAAAHSDMSQTSSNLPLSVDESLKFKIRAEALKMHVSLSVVVAEGYQAVLDGEWMPPQVRRSRSRETEYVKSVLNVRLSNDLREQVRAMLPELTQTAGYRVTESSIAVSWMLEEFGLERPGDGTVGMAVMVPADVRDVWLGRAEARGLSLQGIAEDGIRALMDGSWMLPRPARSAGAPRVKLTVRVGDELHARLTELASGFSSSYGLKVYPGTIVRAILTRALGDPAE